MIHLNFDRYPIQTKQTAQGNFIFDIIRKKYVALQPEEWVRQHIIHYLIQKENYPKGLISVERQIEVNGLSKRYDLVVFGRDKRAWMIIECKEPQVPITQKTLNQLLQYHQVLQCPYWLLTNGDQTFCAQIQKEKITWLSSLPPYGS